MKKLKLNKETISFLSKKEMNNVRGGNPSGDCAATAIGNSPTDSCKLSCNDDCNMVSDCPTACNCPSDVCPPSDNCALTAIGA